MSFRRSLLRPSVMDRVPGLASLAAAFGRVAAFRVGRLPVGLLALLPVAIAIDLFDAADELFLGPVGMAAAFLLEGAFVLGVTGRPGYALGFAAVDLVPGLDVVPLATLTLVGRILGAWRDGDAGPEAPFSGRAGKGPVIDV